MITCVLKKDGFCGGERGADTSLSPSIRDESKAQHQNTHNLTCSYKQPNQCDFPFTRVLGISCDPESYATFETQDEGCQRGKGRRDREHIK